MSPFVLHLTDWLIIAAACGGCYVVVIAANNALDWLARHRERDAEHEVRVSHLAPRKPLDRANFEASEETLDRLYPRDRTGHRIYNPDGPRVVDLEEARRRLDAIAGGGR